MRFVVLVSLLAACVDAPVPTGPHGESHVSVFDQPAVMPRKVDILFAIDDSIAMSPYVERMRAIPPALVAGLQRSTGGMPDLHVGVVTSVTPLGNFVTDTQHLDGARTGNFDGSLADAVASLIDVGTAGATMPSLLDATHAALEANPGGFMREDADLVLITLGAKDDASPGFPADYAAQFERAKQSFEQTLAIGIYPARSPRFMQFHSALHSPPRITSIDAADYAGAFGSFACPSCSALAPCMPEPADLAPDLPGGQFDCSILIVDDEDGGERVLPPCTATSPAPCWTIERDLASCFSDEPAVVRVRGYAPPFRPHLRGQCVTN